jgi:uncharacterized protein (TIGR00299 family) protein
VRHPNVLWIDAGNGAAGDMLLAALLDAGADLPAVRDAVGRLPVGPVEFDVRQVRRHGLRALHVAVRAPDPSEHRSLNDVTAIISRADLRPVVEAFARATFERLADAEARVHGIGVEEVHFHEVGALDAIVDVVGCAVALDDLGGFDAGERIVSPVALGTGSVDSAHGRLPLPAPAVLEVLTRAGAPIRPHPAEMELCTPTGAALLTTLATGWGPAPACTPVRVGVGAGTADPAGHPNVLRVLTGSRDRAATASWQTAPLRQIETTVDDLDPRIWPDLLESLRGAGAHDAWCAPALMRKGRPGHVLSVLADPDRVDLLCRIVFEQTTTFGVRVFPVERRALPRDRVAVPVGDGTVHVKRAYLDERVVTAQPEYDEALAAARRGGTPVASVLAEVRRRLDDGRQSP